MMVIDPYDNKVYAALLKVDKLPCCYADILRVMGQHPSNTYRVSYAIKRLVRYGLVKHNKKALWGIDLAPISLENRR